MQQITVDKNELYSFIKQAVKEVLHEEKFRFWMDNLPTVSGEEMQDIETTYGKPDSVRDIACSDSIEV
jgi:hypothetical protein